MTNDEAVRILHEESCGNCSWGSSCPNDCDNDECDVKEAFSLAISALSRDSTYRRALYLLDATYRLLVKQAESRYVLNILETTVDYDDADCDGNCLMEDIKDLFFEAEYHPEPPKEET